MTDIVKRPSKLCGYCGTRFYRKPRVSSGTFAKWQFCSRPCAQKGQRRGVKHAPRTHCRSGKHEWIPENIWTDCRGHGKCKPCQQARDKGRKRPSRKRRAAPKATHAPRPLIRAVPVPVTPQPSSPPPRWRPPGFSPVPNTRRSA